MKKIVIMKILLKNIFVYSSEVEWLVKNYFILILNRYKRQYMPIINKYGEKEVWVNCFCEHWNWDLKTRPVEVRDGGNCFFNLKINLSKNIYYNLMINGDA